MRLGVRGKLFFASLALIGAGGLASGLYLEGDLQTWLRSRLETELFRHARAARDAVEVAALDARAHHDPIPAADAIADRLAGSTGSRITIIADDGRVIGDSDLTIAEVRAIENHGGRPEVVAALADGEASASRYSTTLRNELLYTAVVYQRDGRGVVRAALPLSEIDALVRRLRFLLLVAGAFGIGIAVFMSGLASHFMTRTLRALVGSAQALAHGEQHDEVPISSTDELGGLAGSLKSVARELERTVAALAHERDRVETVLEGMTEAVIALDAERRVTMINAAGLALLELEDLPRGRGLLEAVRAPALTRLVDQIGQGAPADAEFELPGPPLRLVHARAARLRADGGTVIVIHEVTELRRLETIRRDFVANVSHELRTPISVIRANAETLLHGAIDDPNHARRFVSGVLRNAERLSALIADLLDLSRIEAGEHNLELRDIGLASVVRTAVDVIEPTASTRDTELAIEIDSELEVRADPGALEQVLLNLLDNAVKYTPEGSRVVVRAARGSGGNGASAVKIEVRDNGVGIADEHRARIFERFYRVDLGRSRDAGGTGLGLAIVKHLVDAMGGEVGLDHATPRGAVFWFTLRAGAAS